MEFKLSSRGAFVASFFLLCSVGLAGVERVIIDHAHVVAIAEKLSASPYQTADRTAPKFFREINYDTYRRITFKPEQTLWRDSEARFQLQFFHPGYLFTQMVRLNEFTDTHSQPIPFSQNFFDYHELTVPLLSRWGLDFAGFRILHPVNQPDKWDELIAFLGGTYYRGLGRHHVYGVSARALALNAGGPPQEEFPAFIEFWIRKPDPAAVSLIVHALLDGPSVAGAYTFTLTPGEEFLIETRATLFFRRQIEMPGFAPLSSMFWFGEGSANRYGDFRPEVHDSDGLLVAPDATTRLWRPLLNSPGLAHTDFDVPAFAGFGLLQRDREFRNYEDMEAHYERRPGVWTEPVGPWPPGRVRLVEMPADNEYHDNVTAYWSPREPIAPGRPFELAWKQRWTSAATFGGPAGWVSATRQTVQDGAPDHTRFIIDFDAASLANVPPDAPISADVTITDGATVTQSQLFRNEASGARRLVLRLQAPVGHAAVEARARLMLGREPLTETWVTRWQP